MVLPAPDRPTSAGAGAAGDGEAHAAQGRGAAGVGELDAGQFDGRWRGVGGGVRGFGRVDVVLDRQRARLLDPAHRAQSLLELGRAADQLGHRARQEEDVQEEGDQFGDRHRVVGDEGAAHAEHHQERGLDGGAADHGDEGAVAGADQPGGVRLLDRVLGGARLAALGAVGLDRAGRAQGAVEDGADRSDGRL